MQKNTNYKHFLHYVPVGAARVFGVQMWLGETHRPSIPFLFASEFIQAGALLLPIDGVITPIK